MNRKKQQEGTKTVLVVLSPQRNDPQFSSDFLSLASTTVTSEFTRLFPPSWLKSAEQASSCALSFYFAYIIFSQRPAVSLCSRCREGWARSRMNGSQLYRGWAMKPLSQVAAAPGQVAFVRAHTHACSIFVPILSRLCLFPLCLSTTQARCGCTVSQNGPYCAQPKCVAGTRDRLHAVLWIFDSVTGAHLFLGFYEMRKACTVTQMFFLRCFIRIPDF